ncbi:hypothetical protein ABIA33_001187 [Streptacidiphilus sp. MAP12-16]|uniref:hypothetical protein n=1 Tax=Streptacidiphilus sp. MAP12-16 TaxID=3156300 RepID=UPI003518A307
MRLRRTVRHGFGRGIGLGIGLGAAGLVAGPALLLGTAGTASAASAATPVSAGTAGTAGTAVCGVDFDALSQTPLTLRFKGLHGVYRAGGQWSRFRLTVRTRAGQSCAGVRPVVVFGARNRTLRRGDVRLQWRQGSGWHRVSMVAAQGSLVGQVGPGQGLTLPARSRTALPLRMRLAPGAPPGQWLTMAVGFEPVTLAGQTVPLPVGISDPHYFRVVRATERRHDAPQLAETGGSGLVPLAAGGSALALGGGVALVACARRRPPMHEK